MLSLIALADADLSPLSAYERLAVEYLLRDELSELARERRTGDTALLLAISAAEVLHILHREMSSAEVDDLLDRVRHAAVGQLAIERAAQLAHLSAA